MLFKELIISFDETTIKHLYFRKRAQTCKLKALAS